MLILNFYINEKIDLQWFPKNPDQLIWESMLQANWQGLSNPYTKLQLEQ